TLISAIAISIGPQARCRGWSSGGIVSRPWQEVGLAPRAGSVERVVYHPVQPPVIEAPDVRKDLAREAAATFLIGAERHPQGRGQLLQHGGLAHPRPAPA